MSLNLVKILVLFLAILMIFTSFKNDFRNQNLYRWFCALLLLPATIAATILIKINAMQSSIITTTDTNLFKSLFFIDLELYIESLDIVTITCLVISLQSFLFIAEKSIFLENFLVTISTTLLLVLMQIFSNLFIISIIFSIGSIIITFERILICGDNIPIKDLTRDFIWQRISDFLNITGLLILVYNTGNISIKKITSNYFETNHSIGALLFISAVVRIISIKQTRNDSITSSSVFHISDTQYKFYTAFGSLILLIKMRIIIFNYAHITMLYQAISGTLLLVALTNLIINHKNTTKNLLLFY